MVLESRERVKEDERQKGIFPFSFAYRTYALEV
jgi:hypothetical protein